jgi:hypothetical protein
VFRTTHDYKQLSLSYWEATKSAETWTGSSAPLCRTSQIILASERLCLTNQLREGGKDETLRQASGVLRFRGRRTRVAFELPWSDSAALVHRIREGIASYLLFPKGITRRSPSEPIGSGPNGGLHCHFSHNAVKWSDPSTERYPSRPLPARRHLARRS